MSAEQVIKMAKNLLANPDPEVAEGLALHFSRIENQSLWRQLREMGICLWAEEAGVWPRRVLWDPFPRRVPKGDVVHMLSYPRETKPTWSCETGCGEQVEDRWDRLRFEDEVGVLRRDRVCFSCAFWILKQETPAYLNKVAIVNGETFTPHEAKLNATYGLMLGCAGSRFTILYNDGRVVRSNDVWCQGKIPDRFRGYFPDNATLLHEEPVFWERLVRFKKHEDRCWTRGEYGGDFCQHPETCLDCGQVISALTSGEREAPI